MSSSKKFYLYGDLAAGDYLLHTVYYIHTGKEGDFNQRECKRGNSSQSWVENTNMTVCISCLQTLINACRKTPVRVNFIN
jgi:hypothetical protein